MKLKHWILAVSMVILLGVMVASISCAVKRESSSRVETLPSDEGQPTGSGPQLPDFSIVVLFYI